MKRLSVIFLVFVMADIARAQVSGVVAAMDTHLPLRDVKVIYDTGGQTVTDWRGRFTTDASMNSATIVVKGYYPQRKTKAEMMRDTVFLMPTEVKLAGVEVFAPKAGLKPQLWARDAARSGKKPSTGLGFDFFRMFDKSKRTLSPKEWKKFKGILDYY